MTLKITRIFQPAELQQLDSQGQTLLQEFIVAAPVEKVWAVISDNDLLRRKMNMGVVDFTYHPASESGSVLEGEYNVPFGKAHFYEKPYEWVARSYSTGIRLFDKGPMRYASLSFHLEAVDAEHTKIKTSMKVVLNGPLKRLYWLKLQKSTIRFQQVILDLLRDLRSNQPPSFEPSMNPVDPKAVKQYQNILKKLEPFHAQIEALADYRARASARYLQRLRPYEIADHYKLPRQNTLAFFLEGTQVGLFALNWDILCPGCRGAKKQSKSLRELERKVHCEACGINFEVIESKDVELSFQFAGELAVDPAPMFCIGNPGRSPSIHAQLPFAPNEKRQVALHLPGQIYRLRDMKEGHLLRLIVDDKGLAQLNRTDVESLKKKQNEVRVQPGFHLEWDNPGSEWQVLRFDCLDLHVDAATADQVTSLPAYQHLFGDDALRPGMQLGVGHLVFLFSDIRGSTQLYRELGDSKAFRLVQDHFAVMEDFIKKEGGSIVKTIGDAVMASFINEEAAIMAAMAIQNFYASSRQENPLQGLKIALHSGPCIMVNLNDHMDYFGTTVNICSRLLDQATDEDIVVSGSLFQMPKVQEFLSRQNLTWTQDEQILRGFQGAKTFYRLKLLRQMPARLTS